MQSPPQVRGLSSLGWFQLLCYTGYVADDHPGCENQNLQTCRTTTNANSLRTRAKLTHAPTAGLLLRKSHAATAKMRSASLRRSVGAHPLISRAHSLSMYRGRFLTCWYGVNQVSAPPHGPPNNETRTHDPSEILGQHRAHTHACTRQLAGALLL